MVIAEKTLKETLGEVVKETSDTSTAQAKEKEKGISQTQEVETKSEETTEPEYVSGVDISDLSEQEKQIARKVLPKKAGLLEKGYQKGYAENAQYRKEREQLENLGLSVEEARDVLKKHAEQKQNPVKTTEVKTEIVKTLDKLLKDAPAEQQSALNQMRQIILEETDIGDLKRKIADLEKVLGSVSSTTVDIKRKEINAEVDQLAKKYGSELVEEYREQIVADCIKYKAPTNEILKYVIPLDKLEQAILNTKKTTTTTIKEKINAVSSNGSGMTSSKEAIDTKKSWKSVISELVKK